MSSFDRSSFMRSNSHQKRAALALPFVLSRYKPHTRENSQSHFDENENNCNSALPRLGIRGSLHELKLTDLETKSPKVLLDQLLTPKEIYNKELLTGSILEDVKGRYLARQRNSLRTESTKCSSALLSPASGGAVRQFTTRTTRLSELKFVRSLQTRYNTMPNIDAKPVNPEFKERLSTCTSLDLDQQIIKRRTAKLPTSIPSITETIITETDLDSCALITEVDLERNCEKARPSISDTIDEIWMNSPYDDKENRSPNTRKVRFAKFNY